MNIKAANLETPVKNHNGKTKKRLAWSKKVIVYTALVGIVYTISFRTHDPVLRYFNALKSVPAIAQNRATIVWAVEPVDPQATASAKELRESPSPSPTANLKAR